MLTKEGTQGLGGGGFLDEVQGPQRHHALIGFRLDVAGDHDHLVAQPLPLEGFQHPIAIHLGHGQVQKDQVPVPHQDLLYPFQAVGGLMQVDMPVGRQGAGQLFTSEPRVITYQYIHSVSGLCNEHCAKCAPSIVRCNGQGHRR
ncbi:hypothetical protein D3C79_697260 [compost metagenome]